MKQGLKKQKLRNAEYYDMQETQDALYKASLDGETFGSLMPLITADSNIKLAYRTLKKHNGSYTPGTDGKTIRDISEMDEEKFLTYIRKKLNNYHPKTVRRVEIPKMNGGTRPLGIPVIADKIIQQCILQVLEPICEAKFYEYSYGFRPNRSTEHAIAAAYKFIQTSNLHYVVNIDIKGFFDNVNHKKLLRQMWTLGIRDTKLLAIIKEMLKAKVQMPDGTITENGKGVPQGGVLSPLLANIVLNELDWWIASQWEQQTEHMQRPHTKRYHANGSRNKWSEYNALRKTALKEMFIVRYADDFKIFCRTKEDAARTMAATKQWLEERLRLETSEEKTKVTDLKKTYCEFLGFEIKVRPKAGKYVVVSHICRKAKEKIKIKLKEKLKAMRRPKNQAELYARVNDYNSAVLGIQNYYRLATQVSSDLSDIAFGLKKQLAGQELHCEKCGPWKNKYLKDRYSKSKQVRWTHGMPIIPISYVQHKNPMNKQRGINQYTAEGRSLIHKELGVDMGIMRYLMKNPVESRSVEYNDNRIALYAGQQGKCAVTNEPLEIGNIHCHHKRPIKNGGSDAYENLVLVTEEIHILIHETDEGTIKRHQERLALDEKQIQRLNILRTMAGNDKL